MQLAVVKGGYKAILAAKQAEIFDLFLALQESKFGIQAALEKAFLIPPQVIGTSAGMCDLELSFGNWPPSFGAVDVYFCVHDLRNLG